MIGLLLQIITIGYVFYYVMLYFNNYKTLQPKTLDIKQDTLMSMRNNRTHNISKEKPLHLYLVIQDNMNIKISKNGTIMIGNKSHLTKHKNKKIL